MRNKRPEEKLIEMERLFGSDFVPTSRGRAAPAGGDFEAYRQETLRCARCRLHQGRTQVVFGVGSLDAPVVLVGEGPGADEDAQGEPFVGRAGRLLTRTMGKLGVARDRVYIANIVKCRPPGNRKPELDEIQACIPHLFRQIAEIRPKLVVAMGAVAAGSLLNAPRISVLRERGKIRTVRDLRILITVHPSYCLRNPSDTRLLEADLRAAFIETGLATG